MIFCSSKQEKSLPDNSEQRAAIVIKDGLYCARADHYLIAAKQLSGGTYLQWCHNLSKPIEIPDEIT